mgnify:CR=1 FL=1
MAKTVDIPIDKWVADFKAWIGKIQAWLEEFFRTITTYEMIAVVAIGLGFILLIIGLIII